MRCLSGPKKVVIFCLFLTLLPTTLISIGCGGENKPQLLNFYKKGEESVKSMEPVLEELKEEYKDKVIFKDIDMDLKENKELMDKYHVQSSPTYVVLNKEGKVKETFLGAARKEMLERAISSQLPAEERPKTEPEYTTPMPQTEPAPTPSPTPETIVPPQR